jgi:O-antigen/teichoic acid export membrane protein
MEASDEFGNPDESGGRRTFWQASLFTGSNVAVALLGIVSTTVLARHLGTTRFGSYSFAVAFLTFVALIFEFGLFAPAARLAAVAGWSRQRRIVGAALLLYLPVGSAFCLTIFAFSFGVDDWFRADVGSTLRIAAPIAFAIPFTQIVLQLSQGVDRLHIASGTALGTQALLVGLLLVAVVVGQLDLTTAVVLRCAAIAGGAAAAVFWLDPAFQRLRGPVFELVRGARAYGLHLYVGRLLSIGTYNMDVLMLGAFTTPSSVGFYTLAGSVAAAAGLPVLGMATALFAPLARVNEIRPRLVVIAVVISTVTTLAAWGLAAPFITAVFGEQYSSAARLVMPLALAQGVRGVTGIYNTFLQAQGRGRELRNAGLVLTASNLVLNFGLIPPFGAVGAAWASVLALIANLIAHVVFYRQATVPSRRDTPTRPAKRSSLRF